jgi:hypothetical protein
MRWRNTETPTFAGSNNDKLSGPDIVERLDLLDHADNVTASFVKGVDGSISLEVDGENLGGTVPVVPVKATGAEVDTGTDDAKFVTAKALADSDYIKEADLPPAGITNSASEGVVPVTSDESGNLGPAVDGAASGVLRLPNDGAINSRNAANSADLPLLNTVAAPPFGSTDGLKIGGAGITEQQIIMDGDIRASFNESYFPGLVLLDGNSNYSISVIGESYEELLLAGFPIGQARLYSKYTAESGFGLVGEGGLKVGAQDATSDLPNSDIFIVISEQSYWDGSSNRTLFDINPWAKPTAPHLDILFHVTTATDPDDNATFHMLSSGAFTSDKINNNTPSLGSIDAPWEQLLLSTGSVETDASDASLSVTAREAIATAPTAVNGAGPDAATGDFTFGLNPSDDDPMPAINGFSTIVFKDAPGAFPEIQIESDLATTLSTLASQLETNKGDIGNEALADLTFTSDATHLLITETTPGSAGNSTTLGTNTANITRSAATLEGGSDASNLLSAGDYLWKVTFVTAAGETEAGAASNGNTALAVDPTTELPPELSNIPLGSSFVTGRNIYRTEADGSTYKFVALIADNTTTVYTDNTPDASLGADAPSVNTTTGTLNLNADNGIAQSAPASTTGGILANGQISFYLDEGGSNLKIAIKKSDGNTATVTIPFD